MSSPASSPEAPWPVRTVTQKVADWIARLGYIWVDGEIAQLSRRGRTAYLTLRDPAANMSLPVSCPIELVDHQSAPLSEGARVLVHAKPDFYTGRGSFSLRAVEIRQVGLGELLARIERLKSLLAAEGLFRPERKRALPFLPHKIGLITGRGSAAEHDVVSNTKRRWPGVSIRIINCAVQGRNAAGEIVAALRVLEADETVDVIIVARGGGSVEDLLPFSDESLCRTVSAMATPVVSAIGHEPDTPLLDYVADLRASTPTDAAKRVVPDVAEEMARIKAGRERSRAAIHRLLQRELTGLASIRSRPCLEDRYLAVEVRTEAIDRLRASGRRSTTHLLDLAQAQLRQLNAQVVTLSPQSTLDRGYAVLQAEDGHAIRNPTEVTPGQLLAARVASGVFGVLVQPSREEPQS